MLKRFDSQNLIRDFSIRAFDAILPWIISCNDIMIKQFNNGDYSLYRCNGFTKDKSQLSFCDISVLHNNIINFFCFAEQLFICFSLSPSIHIRYLFFITLKDA